MSNELEEAKDLLKQANLGKNAHLQAIGLAMVAIAENLETIDQNNNKHAERVIQLLEEIKQQQKEANSSLYWGSVK